MGRLLLQDSDSFGVERRVLQVVFALVAATLLCVGIFAGAHWAKAYADEASSAASGDASEASEGDSASEAEFVAPIVVETGAENPDVANAAYAEENRIDPTQRADNSFIYDTTIESLFDEASLYDGRTVQVVGEAIGDLIQANDGAGNCWVMLTSTDQDNPSSISILISAEQASQIDHFGRYGVTGTTLQVRGVYHQGCSEHDGLPDIHVTNSAVIARGVEHPDQFVAGQFVPGIIALIVGAGLLLFYRVMSDRAR